MRKLLLTAAIAIPLLSIAPFSQSHLNEEEPMQSYRQSYFTLLAMNFGPIAGMLKGDIPWDDARAATMAANFTALANMNVAPAFPPGTEQGTTRAKPELWENKADFEEKLANLKAASKSLLPAVQSGDKKAVGGAVKEIGGACKACHDEYKAKDYLY